MENMKPKHKPSLTHIFWLAGATDAGKTTIARMLAEQYLIPTYHYDEYDLAHHKVLAETKPIYRDRLSASLDENWVAPDPETLFQRSLQSFQDRFPLVLDDLAAMPVSGMILAEGFGFLPELLAPILTQHTHAIWLVPSNSFKQASMERRHKPSFLNRVTDPEKALHNLLTRDQLLADYMRAETKKRGYRLLEIDGTLSAEEVAGVVGEHFQLR